MNSETLKHLLTRMLTLRKVEEAIANRYHEGKMRCPTHLSIGQEAVAVGVCNNLTAQDQVYSTHRCHGHYLAKGGDIPRMMAEIYGKATGCSQGKGGSMHLIDLSVGFMGSTAIVSNSIPLALGQAYANQYFKNGLISCVFFGDAAVEEGVLHETLNFASLKKLPMLFICENNLYSVYTPLKDRRPPNAPIANLARAHGIETLTGNGQDVQEVNSITAKARDAILSQQGPFFLEFSTYRYREHCGPNFDNNIGYRQESEYEEWLKKDPIARLKNEMNLSLHEWNALQESIQKTVDSAFQFAEESPFPAASECFTHLYAKES